MMSMVTPSGVLVPGTDRPHSPEWFAMRRRGITATDLPKILGLTQYGNALSVWRDKMQPDGAGDDDAGEPAFWGTQQEPIIAEVWSEKHHAAVRPVGTVAHVNNTWMMASLDRLVPICPDASGACGLEIKTRNAYVAGKWKDDVPDDVLAQVQWGLMVTGLPHMHVACLIGGQHLQEYTVSRDKRLEDYLMSAALPVWQAVMNGIPPDVSADADGVLLRELNKMFASREGAVAVDPIEAERYITDYRGGHRLETEGKRIKTVAKGNMVKLLGGAEVATGEDNEPLWTYKAGDPKDELPADELRRLKAECPELYVDLKAQGFIKTTTPNPTFNLK